MARYFSGKNFLEFTNEQAEHFRVTFTNAIIEETLADREWDLRVALVPALRPLSDNNFLNCCCNQAAGDLDSQGAACYIYSNNAVRHISDNSGRRS